MDRQRWKFPAAASIAWLKATDSCKSKSAHDMKNTAICSATGKAERQAIREEFIAKAMHAKVARGNAECMELLHIEAGAGNPIVTVEPDDL